MTAQLNPRTQKMPYATREEWLVAASHELRELFSDLDKQPSENVLISAGWARGKGSKVHGSCYPAAATDGDTSTIFISPEIPAADPVYLLGVLLHEMIHAADDCQSKHRGWFASTAKAMGLEGKMTSTSIGYVLAWVLGGIAEKLGPYPHIALNAELLGVKRDTNRQLKIECPSGCGYKLRGSRKVLDVGLPECPACHIIMEES